jgi:hypothetical protein
VAAGGGEAALYADAKLDLTSIKVDGRERERESLRRGENQ